MRAEDKISSRVAQVSPSGIRKFFELVIGMEDVISLGVGEPDFTTPWHIREACIYALEKGYTTYTSNFGLIELREEIAKKYGREQKVSYSPQKEILVTTGVSEAFDIALRAILNPGDEVVLPEPNYVAYKPCIIFAGGSPVVLETKKEESFKINPDELAKKITGKTKAIILNYPNNPTGATYNRKELEEIADIAVERELVVISDEIYEKLTYDSKHVCFSSLSGMQEQSIILNGFSKAYAMTGLRVGYVLAQEKLLECMMKIHQYAMLCAPIIAQMGAIEALKNGESEVTRMVKEYNRRRRIIVKRFNEIDMDCALPEGAFYVFPSIKKAGMKSEKFSMSLLRKHKVAVVPGNAFGDCGEGFIRCAYAASAEDINSAVERIEKFLKETKRR